MPKTLEDYVSAAKAVVPEVSPQEAAALLEDRLVLDVREPDEYAEGHMPGAVNVSRGFLEVKADPSHPKKSEALQDRDQKVLVYCAGGIRSLLAAQTLQEMGFKDVVSMAGGYTAWTKENLPTE